MRVADPVHHVELRVNSQGQDSVVFCFPYRADIVDAVRSVPGRRFDWQAKEWWAPRAEATAPFVQGVLERFPELEVAPDVTEWLAKAVKGWVGRVTTARRDSKGWFVLDAIAGDLTEELAAVAEERGDRRWLPFTQEVAEQLLELPGARMDQRALRCATKLQVGLDPAPATLMLVESYGEARFKLEVNWDPDTVGAFVELPAAEAHGRTLPIDPYLLEPLEHFIRVHDIDVGSNAREALARLRTEHDAAIDDVRRSRAADADVLSCEPRLGGELRPFQRAGVRYALQSRRLFIADEQGLGKTVQALAAMECEEAYPAIVICPASLKLNWEREANKWLPRRSTVVVSGRKAVDLSGKDIVIVNYDVVAPHVRRLAALRSKTLVLDESHYCKNPGAQRTKAVGELAEALRPDAMLLALTGTPLVNRPKELVPQLRILGRLAAFGSGAELERRFGANTERERLHWHLRRTCYVRRLKKDVLPQLPAKRRAVVPFDLSNEREYRHAERDLRAWIAERFSSSEELRSRVDSAMRAEALVKVNALRQLVGTGKLHAAHVWIEDFLASGEKLVVFAAHRAVQRDLIERFPDAAHVLGDDTPPERDAQVRRFQSDPSVQLCICSLKVAAHGFTLTAASDVAFLELGWTPAEHDQAEDRAHRIGQTDSVTAWYLLAADTIDERMAALIDSKREVVGAVTDGRVPVDAPMIDALLAGYAGRAEP